MQSEASEPEILDTWQSEFSSLCSTLGGSSRPSIKFKEMQIGVQAVQQALRSRLRADGGQRA